MAVAQQSLEQLRSAGLADVDPEIADLLGRELERPRAQRVVRSRTDPRLGAARACAERIDDADEQHDVQHEAGQHDADPFAEAAPAEAAHFLDHRARQRAAAGSTPAPPGSGVTPPGT